MPGAKNPQALNKYSYVLNNPLRYIDPSGHWHRPGDENYIAQAMEAGFPNEGDWDLYSAITREHEMFDAANAGLAKEGQSTLPQSTAIGHALIGASDFEIKETGALVVNLGTGATVVTVEGVAIELEKTVSGGTEGGIELSITTESFEDIDVTVFGGGPVWPGVDAMVYWPGQITAKVLGRMSVGLLVHEVEHVINRQEIGGGDCYRSGWWCGEASPGEGGRGLSMRQPAGVGWRRRSSEPRPGS